MEIVYRSLFVYAFLWFITRVSGRTTLGELSTFQLLLYVTMGDLVQQSVTQQDYSVTAAILAVGTFSLLTVGISWVNSRSRRLRPLTHGVPIVVVHSGKPLVDVLRRQMMPVEDLMAAARNQGIDTFDDVTVAVLETNGRISFFTGEPREGAADPPTAT